MVHGRGLKRMKQSRTCNRGDLLEGTDRNKAEYPFFAPDNLLVELFLAREFRTVDQ